MVAVLLHSTWCPFKFCNHLDKENNAGSFILIVFLPGKLVKYIQNYMSMGCIAQSVTCLATDACLFADPVVASFIPAQYHTFLELDHEIISMGILLASAESFKKDCCQLQANGCARITG